MRMNRVAKVFLMILAAFAFITIGGFVVMHLWNWLLPALFGWRVITFWQALGLLVLSRILFGRFGGRGFSRSHFRQRMHERWGRMSPEERERFRHGMRGRCADWDREPANEPKP